MSIKELFYFPKSDRKAILFLVVGIVAVVVVIRWANGLSVSPQSPVKKTQKAQKRPIHRLVMPTNGNSTIMRQPPYTYRLSTQTRPLPSSFWR